MAYLQGETGTVVGSKMMDYWFSFVRTGPPEASGAPAWPEVTVGDQVATMPREGEAVVRGRTGRGVRGGKLRGVGSGRGNGGVRRENQKVETVRAEAPGAYGVKPYGVKPYGVALRFT